MREPFAGRANELAAIACEIGAAESGRGSIVLLAGPAGIGKTAIVRRSLATWAGRGEVLRVSGDPGERLLAWGLLDQLTRQARLDELADVLGSAEANPLSAGAALLASLRLLSSTRAVVMVIDDAQWGDTPSLMALTFAARRLSADRILGIIVVRTEDEAALPSGLTRLVAERGTRLELPGLDPPEIASLAEQCGAGRLANVAAQRIRDHTDGVPLHVLELLHDLPPEVLRAPGAELPAPRSLATLVLSRLAACAAGTEQFVVAVAVLGRDCTVADAAAVAEMDDPLPALQDAVRQRLLIEYDTASGRRCAFPHALIRAAVYRDIGVDRRARLHDRAATLSSGPSALAHRVAGCRGTDAALAADLAAQAIADRAAGSLASAADHLVMAARVEPPGERRDGRLLDAISLMIGQGDAGGALLYRPQVESMPRSPKRDLVLARLALLSGRCEAAETWLASAWPAAAAGPDELREHAATAACELAMTLIGMHRLDAAAAWGSRAAGAAVTELTRACSHLVEGASLAAAGLAREARELIEGELSRTCPGPGRTFLQMSLGLTMLHSDEPDEAAVNIEAAILATGTEALPTGYVLEAQLGLAVTDYRRGRWDRAAAEAERLVTVASDLDKSWQLTRAHFIAVYVTAGRGEWDLADSHAAAAAELSVKQAGAGLIEATDALTALAVARDEPEQVLKVCAEAMTDPAMLGRLEPGRLSFWPAYAEALARTGQLAEADAALHDYELAGRARGRRSALAAASRVRGVLDVAVGRHADALAAFAAGIRHLDGLSLPLDEALLRLELGRLLRHLGQRRSAARELGKARVLLARLGATPFLTRCDAELGAGLITEPDASSGLPLTARQLTVARAVAEGRTNRQVASELYVSVKTVEFHLSQILARLGLDSRAQIAQALADASDDVTTSDAASLPEPIH